MKPLAVTSNVETENLLLRNNFGEFHFYFYLFQFSFLTFDILNI